MSASPFTNLAPEALVRDATALDLREFLMRYGHAPLLLVRVLEGDTELELGLKATGPTTGAARPAAGRPFPFRTTHQAVDGKSRTSKVARRDEPATLGRLLAEHPYCSVQVHKREGSDAMSMGRVSIGRAHNKDIVLRHSSVSKFHAWFELEAGCIYVSDAGSTNLTRVNGESLEPRTRAPVDPGDAIRFGAVETILCSSETLWAYLNGDKTPVSSMTP